MIATALLTCTLATALPVAAPPTAVWSFDAADPYGDGSGHGNHLVGASVFVDGLATFDPSAGHSLTAHSADLDALGSGDMTLAFWVQQQEDGYVHYVTKRQSCGERWAFQVNGNGENVSWSQGGGANDLQFGGALDGSLHHVAFVRVAGVSVTGHLDGVAIASRPDDGLSYANARAVTLGRDPGCGGDVAPMALDDVALFAGALSADDIRLLADRTVPDVTLTSPAPGAWTIQDLVLPAVDGRTRVAGTVMLVAAAADAGSGLAGVEFAVDGTPLCFDTEAPYACPWDSTASGPGTHVVLARAIDRVGLASVDQRELSVIL